MIHFPFFMVEIFWIVSLPRTVTSLLLHGLHPGVLETWPTNCDIVWSWLRKQRTHFYVRIRPYALTTVTTLDGDPFHRGSSQLARSWLNFRNVVTCSTASASAPGLRKRLPAPFVGSASGRTRLRNGNSDRWRDTSVSSNLPLLLRQWCIMEGFAREDVYRM